MDKKLFRTELGDIVYWKGVAAPGGRALVFLPGLTADHRLFERQTEYFEASCNVLVWDAPGHGESRPFALDFTLADKAKWLFGILESEKISRPVLIGQSMGGYVAQCFMELYPGVAGGFISIDSAPLKRRYTTSIELAMLRKCEPVYRAYPWEALKRSGSRGCSTTPYGQRLMLDMMSVYTRDEYAKLAGHGFRMLADAMAADLPYNIDCPALLISGEKDRAGSAKRYNRAWSAGEGIPLEWIAGAGHNSNTDRPELVNGIIEGFLKDNALLTKS